MLYRVTFLDLHHADVEAPDLSTALGFAKVDAKLEAVGIPYTSFSQVTNYINVKSVELMEPQDHEIHRLHDDGNPNHE